MRIVIFGLSVSSSWGNGHATLWRSLIAGLTRAGHSVVFYERDQPFYAAHRDLEVLPGRSRLRLYRSWPEVRHEAAAIADAADAVVVTSYCADGRAACELALACRAPVRVFYDLDTPVTLDRLAAGDDVPYLPVDGLGGFDLVLSYTGGGALPLLRERLGARRVGCLHGSVDRDEHRPHRGPRRWSAHGSYLGTWSADRADALDALLLEPARRRPDRCFVVGGSMYPPELAWPANVVRVEHVAPAAHPEFYASSPLTVSVTRGPMAALGHCPSGRLFEAAACGTPVLSDTWAGLDTFFEPGREILIATTADEALAAIDLDRATLEAVGQRARERVWAQHTGDHRAAELVAALENAASSDASTRGVA
jgi:spore maturation protein CgeB